MFLALLLASPAFAQDLIGQWTFESGEETVDATGNWGDLQLVGAASINDGALTVTGSGTSATGWAYAPGYYGGGTITDKTLVSWVTINDNNAWAGSAMSIDNRYSDNFDGIIYGEITRTRWMAGSSYFRRTQNRVTVNETTGSEVQIAISYEDLGWGQVEVTICRDGVQLAQYTDSPIASWGSDAEILFGVRHTYSLTNTRGGLNATIEEARIYDGALSCSELGSLSLDTDSDGDGVFDSEDLCPSEDASGFDADGDGCIDDSDGDGFFDDEDSCIDSVYDSSDIVDDTGCSLDDICPCDDDWKNHGEYVSCVADLTNDWKSEGIISGKEKGSLQSAAGRSDCGK